MTVYVVSSVPADAIADGSARIVIVPARPGARRNAHAACGDDVYIDSVQGGFTGRRRLWVSTCIFRATIVLTPDALPRVVDPRFRERNAYTAEAEAIHRTLQAAETGVPGADGFARDAVARLAGFASWTDLWEHLTHKDRRVRGDTLTRIEREVVGWAVERAEPVGVAA